MTDTLHCSQNVLLVMDTLWFQHIILSSQISSSTPSTTSITYLDSQSDLSSTPSLEEQLSFSSDTDTSPVSPKDDKLRDETESSEDEETSYKYKSNRQLATQRQISSKTRSQSSSPQSVYRLPKHLQKKGATTSLRKTMSCRSLLELEYEEVKGFMDLGFTFKKEQLCPRIWSVIPGLQRLDEYNDVSDQDQNVRTRTESKDNYVRPYLSEAWLIRRPDSPLLNMKIPRVNTPGDMKKHLKCWARTVASTIQAEY